EARAIVDDYCHAVAAQGHEETRRWSYAFDRFHDGSLVRPEMRSAYRRSARIRDELGADPFTAGARYFGRSWDPADDRRPTLSIVMKEIWNLRPDLRVAFPDVARNDRRRFAEWFVGHGALEQGVPEEMVEGTRRELSAYLPLPDRPGAPMPVAAPKGV